MADDLNTAIGNWVSAIADKIGSDRDRGGLIMPGAEIVVARLRAGALTLETLHAGQRVELHREAIPPLRLGMPISVPIDR